MNTDRHVRVTEVGPRDGLQNEGAIVSVEDKIRLVDALSPAGFPEIETSSFVSPKWVPQLADAAEVFAGIDRAEGTRYSALVPNERGLERAMACGVDKLAVFTAASESFCDRNLNTTIAGSIERFIPVFEAARRSSTPLRGYVSCVVRCPFEGDIDARGVAQAVRLLLDATDGDIEISLGETLGVAVPEDVERVLEAMDGLVPIEELDVHLHDTNGRAVDCAARALELGVRRFDASCAGLGGCPYAPGAAGNLATEDLLGLLERDGWTTGVDLEKVGIAVGIAREITGRSAPGIGAVDVD